MKDLGMDRAISRRDFLDGVRIAIGGSRLYPWLEAAAASPYYLPH